MADFNNDQNQLSNSPPSISLPKGGGAIRGIGEKFGSNPTTGTGSTSIPIATSPGRSGFGPNLSLTYDSGSGNGPFGFGWTLPLPEITRKSDKGLPRYRDKEESDVYILSGSEDLVPQLEKNVETGIWERHEDVFFIEGDEFVSLAGGEEDDDEPLEEGMKYRVHRFLPRIEGLFARIERWTDTVSGKIHWRSISGENITTIYGRTAESQIVDPTDSSRVFSWLICESYDDKGNAIVYQYSHENSQEIDLRQVHENNRTDSSRSSNRYLKRIKYGNLPSRLIESDLSQMSWLFEVVFDYDEGHYQDIPFQPGDNQFVNINFSPSSDWTARQDPFSTYRSGYEIRTYRMCRRILMFHHFQNELGKENYLVSSTEFTYQESPIASFISEVTQSGYVLNEDGRYLKKSFPPLEFEYSKATIHDEIQTIDAQSLENLPQGIDSNQYRWVDLDGVGLSGILTEQADEWFYKPNIGSGQFGPLQVMKSEPSMASLSSGRQQLMDLAGDGQLDLVNFNRPTPGFFERTKDQLWGMFKPFTSLPELSWDDPNTRLIDLTGDGHTDILIAEGQVFTWYSSLAEEGFERAEKVRQALDEEKSPRLVFGDGTQSIFLADMSGDGLTDLVRIRNGEVCYWPNLGYGKFGAKVTMDNSPWFDSVGQFNQQRLRLADIDGSGTTDLIYLGRDGVNLYFNQAGNSLRDAEMLQQFPHVDNLAAVTVIDLFGNGTACLVWSSPLPGDAGRQMRYLDLMGGQKPHLLVKTVNNLGAETRIHFASSTKFYLQDMLDGDPWITRLPFPVHVVERVETYDHISRNRFVTRYAYHHGYFDGEEREFRGFGMVEQLDTEDFASLSGNGSFSEDNNLDSASHVPPVLTKTWFHSGALLEGDRISRHFEHEYYHEPGLSDDAFLAQLLPDSVLPIDLRSAEIREAVRALKGAMLRQEVYALDGTENEVHPYTISEQNMSIRLVQPREGNRHIVFFTHPRESINYHYERNPADPRVQHEMTMEVDKFGNVLKEATIGYGRRASILSLDENGQFTEIPNPDLIQLDPLDQEKQTEIKVTYTENSVTNAIDSVNDHRYPLPFESRTYELTGYTPVETVSRFRFADFMQSDPNDRDGIKKLHIFDDEINYEDKPSNAKQRRLIEHVRTLYRKDDLTTFAAPGEVDSLALPGESYKLAFTPGLLSEVFQRDGQALLSNAADVLGGEGGYALSQDMKALGIFPNDDPDDHWWIPTGRIFLSPDSNHSPVQERAYAQSHFFLPHRYQNPFHTNAVSTESFISYDDYGLLMLETRDALGNRSTVGERFVDGTIDPDRPGNNYRVLQPKILSGPNRNRTLVAFDALGMVVGTAVMGKPEEALGDSIDGFESDLTETAILDHLADPLIDPHAIIGRATTRLVYDLFAYHCSKDQPNPQPIVSYSLARETHDADLDPSQQMKIQHSFSYSDGFGREIQKKIQAEPEKINGVAGLPRWVGSGWTIFNNKGKPVRQYEPFFSSTHRFEFGVQVGVSPILFYDPIERVAAALNPNHTFAKVVFDPWKQTTWDVNDTVLEDPRSDADIQGYTSGYFASLPASPPEPPWQTWLLQRQGGALGTQEQMAADKAVAHSETPTTVYFDALGRPFLTLTDNGLDPAEPGQHLLFATRIELDVEGNQRAVRDAIEQNGDAQGRIVMRFDYDMLGNRIHQNSMEAGTRWLLNDVTGKPIRSWDSRGHSFRTGYDPLRRPLRTFITGADLDNRELELLTQRLVYGEQHPEGEQRNLLGVIYLFLDQAGAVTTEDIDFKGNSLLNTRRLTNGTWYRQVVDWLAVDGDHVALPTNATELFDPDALEAALAAQLEADSYASQTTYDAFNRPRSLTTPHTPGMQPSVIRPGYNEANLLEWVEANLRGAEENGQPVWTPFVTNIDYDAKGQRERIDYGNGASSFYDYDEQTFRLTNLKTTRTNDGDLQNLDYAYDPAGNITSIHDKAQQTIFFNNVIVEAHASYTYDAIYRLIEATGREHLGQMGSVPVPHSHNDAPRVSLPHPGDANAMGRYCEKYAYDAMGNLIKMGHHRTCPDIPSWTRTYSYNEASLIEVSKNSNRLSQTSVGSGNPINEQYVYDAQGNMIRIPHLGGTHPTPNMRWDYTDQLRQADLGGGGTSYYVYNTGGQRVRKVIERQNGSIQKERIYLGGFEIYQEYNGATADVDLQRETLHIMDDEQRVALVETRTIGTAGDDPSPAQLVRFQFSNHLGSASLELDDQAQIISYEEYTPYGSTVYQAVRKQTETPKRYRYTGKERDEESGFYYHGARYYIPWVTRWLSPDPNMITDGLNSYQFTRVNPIRYVDPTGFASDDPPIKGPGEIGHVEKMRKQAKAEYIDPSDRKTILTESEHIEPRKQIVAYTTDRKTGKSKYGRSQYEGSSTLRVEKKLANYKTRGNLGGSSADNPSTARMRQAINDSKEVDVNKNMIDRIEFTKEARDATGSVVTDEQIHRAALAQRGELFELEKSGAYSIDPEKKAEVLKTDAARKRAARKGIGKSAGDVAKKGKRGLRSAAKKGLTRLGKAAPVLGVAGTGASIAYNVSKGNYIEAGVDVIGEIPVVGTAFSVGYAMGTVTNELLSVETQTGIEGTISEIIDNGLENAFRFYFD